MVPLDPTSPLGIVLGCSGSLMHAMVGYRIDVVWEISRQNSNRILEPEVN
jgi:hypothetical protein